MTRQHHVSLFTPIWHFCFGALPFAVDASLVMHIGVWLIRLCIICDAQHALGSSSFFFVYALSAGPLFRFERVSHCLGLNK